MRFEAYTSNRERSPTRCDFKCVDVVDINYKMCINVQELFVRVWFILSLSSQQKLVLWCNLRFRDLKLAERRDNFFISTIDFLLRLIAQHTVFLKENVVMSRQLFGSRIDPMIHTSTFFSVPP